MPTRWTMSPATFLSRQKEMRSINLVVLSRPEIESRHFRLLAPYAVLSITSPRQSKTKIRRHGLCLGVLRLVFNDAEPTASFELPPNIKIMSKRQATIIWRFVLRHVDSVSTIVVHCEAGFSRSPAVAAAICRCLGHEDRFFFANFHPNMHVYRLLLDTKPPGANLLRQPRTSLVVQVGSL